MGIVFVAFSTNYFEKDKYALMRKNASFAATATAGNYIDNAFLGLNSDTIGGVYSVLAATSGADMFLVDVDGNIGYHTNPGNLESPYVSIPKNILAEAFSPEGYENTGIIKGVADTASYIVGVPVMIGENVVASVFTVVPASDLSGFLFNIFRVVFITSIIILVVAFVVIYYITSRMVKPLKQMVDATHSFSEGDFSKRIPVITEDEVGQLAKSFNNMASVLAVNENSRRSFIANVSHELKTPMTTIGGFVDGILDGTIPKEQEEQYLQIVSSEVKRLSRLVHSMLDTARIEAGEMEINKAVFDISELVRQSIFVFEQTVEEHQVRLSGLEVDKIMVYADQDLIHQVVYNLIENAVKFVNFGGEISVSYRKDGDKLYTTIRNTGEGLSKEDSTKIFERFYKSDRSRTGNKSGVGLGLHIVKSIIQYHEGTIGADSVPGEYTEFTFGLAAAEDNQDSRHSKKQPKLDSQEE